MHYYNEFDPQAAAWLQVLIDQHLIPEGVVDTRSIVEVTAEDLGGFVQCHFFAGIGGWPLALQLAGVPASTRLWTGSCPCQPFSVAGEGKGTADERHLWPVFFNLIRACKPDLVLGEQVASAAVLGSSAKPTKRSAGKAVQPVWLDGVFADLESASYTCGSSDIPAAGVGAPHIRQRCWWGAVRMADSDGRDASTEREQSSGEFGLQPKGDGTCGMGDTSEQGWEGRAEHPTIQDNSAESCHTRATGGDDSRMGHAPSGGLGIVGDASLAGSCGHADGSGECGGVAYSQGEGSSPGGVGTALTKPRTEGEGSGGVAYTNGRDASAEREQCGGQQRFQPDGNGAFWSESRWHPCRDGKYRRVPAEPGLFPLADGLPYRVARRRTVRPALLRGAGNAICPEVAAEFVKAFYEVIES